ncbi:threonylcarbamoyl-AMP synthase [Rhizobium leguminosarum bv. trifolii]|uniref:Threonylcarbamoyl-AMP synthase n=2 Tax=Rhizobium TaxID=379 RepID=A0A3E1B6E0_RHILT|nr:MULTISPECIES: L-threonylcarbamoyladenylate synthase [Rhizobium]KPH05150.1 translation factor Sua5 [Rhizobium acidisoli]QAS81090.1 threonylcarbamoyl-AMP synthase [Rhizobium acidisoli]RFB86487.1 threonylcarbamoyl-AMP synthase [Rhizobium leguminosarum bv. trifolii]RFB86747.1 threonylcarbamoyl-AMP synthase [Rhizobium leguminosarum bv. trifolii]
MTATRRFDVSDSGIEAAAWLMRNGEVVAFPTETVYGLGADASSPAGIERIYEAKGRPRHNPLIIHVSDLEMARRMAHFNPEAELAAASFWPGPLTLLLPKREDAGLATAVTAGMKNVAIRFPSSSVAQRLIRAVGFPVAAPSANRSGKVTSTRFAEVARQLDGRISGIVEEDTCDHGLESTILSLVDSPTILRHGSVTREALEALLGPIDEDSAPQKVSAPGQLKSHYAPEAAVQMNVDRPSGNMVWVGFGPESEGCQFTLSFSGDLHEAARNLYTVMSEADASAGPNDVIAFAPIPLTGLGWAINDRLRRAAAPRPA